MTATADTSTGASTAGPTRQGQPGLGHPRLIFAFGGQMQTHTPQREFELVHRITSIGSDEDADLRLTGLEPRHGEIRRDEDDNYSYVPLDAPTGSTVHGRQGEHAVLRTGSRIELGGWTVSFYREEFADSSVAADSEPGRKFARMRDEAQLAQPTDDGPGR